LSVLWRGDNDAAVKAQYDLFLSLPGANVRELRPLIRELIPGFAGRGVARRLRALVEGWPPIPVNVSTTHSESALPKQHTCSWG
jgi:hypothetical protein